MSWFACHYELSERMEHPRGPFCGRAVVGKASQARYEGRRANSLKVTNEFGVVGLGRMGGGLAKQALGKKMVVVGKLDLRTTLGFIVAQLLRLNVTAEYSLRGVLLGKYDRG